MKNYLPNQDIALAIAIVDDAGAAVTATAGSYRVLDGEGNEVKAATDLALTDPATSVNVTVAAADNTIPADQVTDGRTVELTLTTSFGTHMQQVNYLLQPLDPLVAGFNSFQSYAQAEFLAAQMPALGGWAGAAKNPRCAAMIAAREQMCQLQYRFVRDVQSQLTVDHPVVADYVTDLTTYTAEQIASLPTGMQSALKKAQLIQADYLLGGSNPVAQAREEGLLSHTVGESSSMFRPGMAPLKYPICEAAIKALFGYLRGPFKCGIGRA